MKIATNTCLALLAAFGLCLATPAFAQSLTEKAIATTPASSSIALPQQSGSSSISGAAAIKNDPPSLAKGKDDVNNVKIPESVNHVVDRLNAATEGVTLDDLNSAREAMAKLDILIEIEKRLNDLTTIRQEREEKSMANAIPASALGLGNRCSGPRCAQQMSQPMAMSMPALNGANMAAQPPAAIGPTSDSLEIVRIAGASGNYTATIKAGEGKTKLIREGDKLSDGSEVKGISSKSVTLSKGGKSHTVTIKDVAVVFNGR